MPKILNQNTAWNIAIEIGRNKQRFKTAEVFFEESRTYKRYGFANWVKNKDFRVEIGKDQFCYLNSPGSFAVWIVKRKPKCLSRNTIQSLKERLSDPNTVVNSFGDSGFDRAWLEHHHGHLWKGKKKLTLSEAEAILSIKIPDYRSKGYVRMGTAKGLRADIKNWCDELEVDYEIYRRDYIFIPDEAERIAFNLKWL